MRILDCKAGCRQFLNEAPTLLDTLDPPCRDHFDAVTRYLDLLGVKYQLDPRLVRGLDYYVRTTFEIIGPSLGAQNAVLGGGRYDGLVKELGGPAVAGFGFASGMERLILCLPSQAGKPSQGPDVFVATLGQKAVDVAFPVARELRRRELWVEMDLTPERSFKSKSRRASQMAARYMLFVGESEVERSVFTLKNMQDGTQKEIPQTNIDRLVHEVIDE